VFAFASRFVRLRQQLRALRACFCKQFLCKMTPVAANYSYWLKKKEEQALKSARALEAKKL
jgi:hypothetical protein